MKRLKNKLAALTLAALMMTGGCSLLPPIGSPGQEGGQTTMPAAQEIQDTKEVAALTVGGTEVPVSQAMIYAFLMQMPMENAAGDQIWKGVHPAGGQFDDRLRSEVKKQITQITVIADKAAREGMTLSDEEKENADARGTLLFEEYPQLSQAGTTEAAAQAVYRQSMLAGKYYDEMTKDYQPELTGEEEADCNVREIHQIFVAEGDISHLGKSKDQEQLAAALLKRVKNGEGFDALADTYSSAGCQPVVVLNDKGYAFDADAWVDETFLAEALKLKAGQVSGVFKTELGWHVIYCAGIGDPDLCEEARAALIGQKKQNYFADLLKNDFSDVVVTEGDGWPYIGVLTF